MSLVYAFHPLTSCQALHADHEEHWRSKGRAIMYLHYAEGGSSTLRSGGDLRKLYPMYFLFNESSQRRICASSSTISP
ncbi:hypothetical protein L210DRAFT_952145 [Boletus edulis BED1]|uniref:Uncharacterized protein n=1 Tax=Boletus edulis BED1 TaxID=1328754 RepID=A0AAD4BLR3_BOLED|nr:hypothetical protein L210DRAFT_952145 [Boletus edulis BED1]